MNNLRRFIVLLILPLLFLGCAPARKPVPPGVVPTQEFVLAQDERYGHDVLASLVEQYPLSKDDQKIERVRGIVDRLARAARADSNPWHVYVFDTPGTKNAAATRGNYIFVWSGMIDSVQSDTELATILAHEIGHVLAGHTKNDPADEANAIIASTANEVASQVVSSLPGAWGLAAGLAGALVEEGVKALIVNPDSQRKELEADYVGLFLMADAGYDPDLALEFWRRAEADPELSGAPLTFLSSHPSSDLRLKELEQYIEQARTRYREASKPKGARSKKVSGSRNHSDSAGPLKKAAAGTWVVANEWASVFEKPRAGSKVRIDLPHNSELRGELLNQHWLSLKQPIAGYVKTSEIQSIE